MTALLRFSVRHPRWVTVVSLVIALAAATFVPRVSLRLDARSLIPQGHPSMAEGDRAAALFDHRDVVVVAISGKQGIYRPAALQLLKELSLELEQVEGIVPGSVSSLATVPRLFVQDDVIDLQPLLARELTPSAETARRVRHETEALGLDDGILVSRDGRAAAIYAEVEPGADRSALGRRVRELLARKKGAGDLEIHFSGTAMAQAVLGEAAAHDLVRQVPLVLVVVFAVMMLAFRHPVPALVSLSEVGVSLVCTVGLMGLLGQAVFVTTLALPVILIVIGVTDDVYALNRYFAELRRDPGRPAREIVEASLGAVARPVTLTAATTVTGLLSLALTPLEPQRVFGLYGAVSVALSTLATFTLLPALLVLLAPRTDPSRRSFAGRTEALLERFVAAIRIAHPRRIAVGAALILACAVALTALRLRIEDNWIGNLPPSSSTVRGDRAINRLLAGTNTLDLMIDSGKPEGFLEPGAVAALGAVEDALSASPDIGAIQSAFGEIARVNASLLDVPYRPYREALRRRERIGRAEIEQALLLLASSGNSPGPVRLDPDYRRARLTVFVRSANYSRMSAVLRLATETARRRFGPGFTVTPFGDGWIGLQSIRLLVLGQVSSISFAVVANLALLVLLFRSLPTALVAIAPVVFSVLLVFGVLAAVDAPLGTANSMFAAIALGIGIDYSIHLVASFREKLQQGLEKREALINAMVATGPAILTSAFAIIAGFSILTFSEVPPNRNLGLLVSLSLAVCAVATLTLVPTLLLLRDRRTE